MTAIIAIIAIAIVAMLGTATLNSPSGREALQAQLHELVVKEADLRAQSEFQAAMKNNKGAKFRKSVAESLESGCPAYQCVDDCNKCSGPKCKCISDGSCGIFGLKFRCQPLKTP